MRRIASWVSQRSGLQSCWLEQDNQERRGPHEPDKQGQAAASYGVTEPGPVARLALTSS